MIIEDERDYDGPLIDFINEDGSSIVEPPQFNSGAPPAFVDVLARNTRVRSRTGHTQLKEDLIEHMWQCFRNGPNY